MEPLISGARQVRLMLSERELGTLARACARRSQPTSSGIRRSSMRIESFFSSPSGSRLSFETKPRSA